jgi:hypothetical protein
VGVKDTWRDVEWNDGQLLLTMKEAKKMMGRLSRALCALAVAGTMVLCASSEAHGLELAGTASFGAFQVGTTTMFAVAPGVALRLGPGSGVNLTLQDSFVMFPGPGRFGFDNRVSVGAGYSWPTLDVDLSAVLSGYWMPACGPTLCGQVMGVAPGARARVSYFLHERFGVAVTGDVGWYGGRSLVLPDSTAVTVVMGPVLRWKGPGR